MTSDRAVLPGIEHPSAPHGDPTVTRPLRIALVNMPWALCDRPSIQCGLLKADLVLLRHEVDVHYLNLSLAATLGADMYMQIAEMPSERTLMLGEWLFSVAAFGPNLDGDAYRAAFPTVDEVCANLGLTFAELCELRNVRIPRWLDDVIGGVDWRRYDVIGFTSTFEQNVAALAAAALIKQRAPAAVVVFGGANVDGEMGQEYLRRFSRIDYVVVGEGDISFPLLVAALSRGELGLGVPGVAARNAAGGVEARPPVQVQDMDAIPVPDYGDYFGHLDRLGAAAAIGSRPVRLVAELSRGCWWGQKHHCTFCGLNALGMNYRSKSPERAIHELTSLTGMSKQLRIDTVDNILDMRYIGTFCDDLASRGYDLSMFFEVKANLTADQLRRLRRAGVTQIQPGIESLSTRVLRIMDKGTDLLTNVRLLKWARYYGIAVGWNILTGFPGETDDDYLGQVALMPALHHLSPPHGCGDLWLERFSPYFIAPPSEFHDIRPRQAYSFIYPVPGLDLAKIAYFFDHTADSAVSRAARSALTDGAQAWRERWEAGRRSPMLFYQRGPGWIRLIDGRHARPREQYLDGWRAAAYETCGDSPRSVSGLARRLAEASALNRLPADAELAAFLDTCVDNQTMITESGRYLTLALPTSQGSGL